MTRMPIRMAYDGAIGRFCDSQSACSRMKSDVPFCAASLAGVFLSESKCRGNSAVKFVASKGFREPAVREGGVRVPSQSASSSFPSLELPEAGRRPKRKWKNARRSNSPRHRGCLGTCAWRLASVCAYLRPIFGVRHFPFRMRPSRSWSQARSEIQKAVGCSTSVPCFDPLWMSRMGVFRAIGCRVSSSRARAFFRGAWLGQFDRLGFEQFWRLVRLGAWANCH